MLDLLLLGVGFFFLGDAFRRRKRRREEAKRGATAAAAESGAREGKKDDEQTKTKPGEEARGENCGCIKSFLPMSLRKTFEGAENAFKLGIGQCYKCD